MSHFVLAAALALLGRVEQAQAAARAGLTLNPQFTIARVRATFGDSAIPSGGERMIEGMRKAGVPEQ